MSLLKKSSLLIFAILLLTSCAEQPKTNELEVPVLLFLTGNQAAIGQEILNGFNLAINDFEQKNPDVSVKLLIEDTKDDPKVAIAAYNSIKLKTDAKYVIIAGDSVAEALLPIITKDNIAVITTTVSSENIVGEKVFRGFFSAKKQGGEIGFEITKAGHKKISVLALQNQFSHNFLEGFKEYLIPDNVEFYSIAQHDVKSSVLKSISDNPETLVVVGFGPAYSEIFKELSVLNYKKPIYASDAIGTPYYYQAAGGYPVLKNVFYWCVPYNDKNSLFSKKYFDKYNQNPSLFSGYAYDSLLLLLNAVNKCESSVDICLRKVHTQGALQTIHFNENQQITTNSSIKSFKEEI